MWITVCSAFVKCYYTYSNDYKFWINQSINHQLNFHSCKNSSFENHSKNSNAVKIDKKMKKALRWITIYRATIVLKTLYCNQNMRFTSPRIENSIKFKIVCTQYNTIQYYTSYYPILQEKLHSLKKGDDCSCLRVFIIATS